MSMNAKDTLAIMDDMYRAYFGGGFMPYGGKDYPILTTIAKKRGGFDQVLADFQFLLESDLEWLQGGKTLQFYMKFYASIGGARDSHYKNKCAVSLSELQQAQADSEDEYRERMRKELFNDN